MSDYSITPEAHQGYRSILLTTPFHPSVKQKSATEYLIKFNQAYVFDYLNNANLNSPIKISGMDAEFTVEADTEYLFEVELQVNTVTGGINSASFFQRSSPASPTSTVDQTLVIDDGSQSSFSQYLSVCTTTGPSLKDCYLRDNIHWWGRKIVQHQSANTEVGHPINTGELLGYNQPLKVRAISGHGSTDYKPVEVFNSGNNLIIVSGVTGFGVMYGDGPEGQETYHFLEYPLIAPDTEFEHRLIAIGDPPAEPAWSTQQYLPQIADGAAQGDILYYDATEEKWVILPAPTTGELAAFYGDPVLHHNGTAPYWGQDDYYLDGF